LYERFKRRAFGDKPVIDARTSARFAAVVGDVLRRVRQGRGLSLRQVTVRSGGRFKPSSVASYERGERQVSLERFFALADVYDVTPERIVAAIAHELETQAEDLDQDLDQRRTRTRLTSDIEVLEPFAVGARDNR
jgi:transcriptional regulator with XRE-family HTH domain